MKADADTVINIGKELEHLSIRESEIKKMLKAGIGKVIIKSRKHSDIATNIANACEIVYEGYQKGSLLETTIRNYLEQKLADLEKEKNELLKTLKEMS